MKVRVVWLVCGVEKFGEEAFDIISLMLRVFGTCALYPLGPDECMQVLPQNNDI